MERFSDEPRIFEGCLVLQKVDSIWEVHVVSHKHYCRALNSFENILPVRTNMMGKRRMLQCYEEP